MTATLGGWLLILLLLGYLLHILWRQIAARSPVAIASFIAAYFVLAAFFRLSEPYTPLRPVWLPFVYSYSWLAIAAALWLPASARPTRRGLLLPAESPRIAALLVSQLCFTLGSLLTAPALEWRPMAAYVMLPPLMAVLSYLLYRVFLFFLQRSKCGVLSWRLLLIGTIAAPIASMWLGGWIAPILLGWT